MNVGKAQQAYRKIIGVPGRIAEALIPPDYTDPVIEQVFPYPVNAVVQLYALAGPVGGLAYKATLGIGDAKWDVEWAPGATDERLDCYVERLSVFVKYGGALPLMRVAVCCWARGLVLPMDLK